MPQFGWSCEIYPYWLGVVSITIAEAFTKIESPNVWKGFCVHHEFWYLNCAHRCKHDSWKIQMSKQETYQQTRNLTLWQTALIESSEHDDMFSRFNIFFIMLDRTQFAMFMSLVGHIGIFSRHRYGCFRKYRYPQIIHFNRVFLYKPSILGYPYFGNTHMSSYRHSDLFPPQQQLFLLQVAWPLFLPPSKIGNGKSNGGTESVPRKLVMKRFFFFFPKGSVDVFFFPCFFGWFSFFVPRPNKRWHVKKDGNFVLVEILNLFSSWQGILQ